MPPLTLSDALARAANADPGLEAASAGVDAAQGGRRQAMARPNPELGVEVENFSGAGALRGFQSAETTFRLSQEVELGGKRDARVAVANGELSVAEADALIRRLELFRDVEVAYYEAAAAQQSLSIARDRLASAQAMSRAVQRRVNAARDPLMASARATATLAEAESALQRAELDAASKRALLASYWDGAADFTLPPDLLATSEEEGAAPDADHAPDVMRLLADRDRASAAVSLERAQGYQNPTLSAGFRRFGETDDGAFVAGVTIPLGVFDRNRGAIARADAEARRAAFELDAQRRQYQRELARLTSSIAADREAARASQARVIPAAEEALALARNGYERGAFSYLDVIEAERALADARQIQIETLLSLHTNLAALHRLTGRFTEPLHEETAPQ